MRYKVLRFECRTKAATEEGYEGNKAAQGRYRSFNFAIAHHQRLGNPKRRHLHF
jgi:hypothetical protein